MVVVGAESADRPVKRANGRNEKPFESTREMVQKRSRPARGGAGNEGTQWNPDPFTTHILLQ